MRIVTVHGFGDPQPGEILKTFVQNASRSTATPFTREELIVGDRTFARAQSSGNVSEILEVNWTDLRPNTRGVIGSLRHLLLLICAMLAVAQHGGARGGRPSGLTRAYRAGFEAVLVWSPFPALQVMFLAVLHDSLARGVATACITLLVAGLAVHLGKYSRWYLVGLVWAGGMLVLEAISIGNPDHIAELTVLSAQLYANAQVLLGLLALAACLMIIAGRLDLSLLQRLTYAALLYTPLIILAGLTAPLWAGALALVDTAHGLFDPVELKAWGQVFSGHLGYDLRQVELAFTLAIGSIGLFALLSALSCGLISYVRREKDMPRPDEDREPYRPGRMAQDAVAALLFVTPLALCGALIVTVMSLLGQESSQPETGAGILSIFAVSALKILPLLAFAVSPLRAIVDVIGDALLFLAPEVLDRRDEAVARVRAALAYMNSTGTDEIVVVAHGQGSLIAGKAALEASESIIRLVTFGSPVGSFYNRFLGRWSSGLASLNPLWINAYHSQDYVGGPIDGVRENCVMEHGGHTGYWADPRSWSIVDQLT